MNALSNRDVRAILQDRAGNIWFGTYGSGVIKLSSGQIASFTNKSPAENVGQASSLPVYGASSPRVSGGKMPPELADKMSAPHFQTGAKDGLSNDLAIALHEDSQGAIWVGTEMA